MAAVCAGAICVVSASIVIGREPMAQESMSQGGMGVQVLPDGAQPKPAAAATGLPAGVTHGNYCGADWANGEWKNDSTKNGVCKIGATLTLPTDETDALCMAHDKAYCTTDPAAKDLADQQFIGDLQKQKLSLQAQWTANGCDKPAPAVTSSEQKPVGGSGGGYLDKGYCVGDDIKAPPHLGPCPREPAVKVTPVAPVISETCVRLASERAYVDAAITAYTAKREQYQEDLAEQEAQDRLAKSMGDRKPGGNGTVGGNGRLQQFNW